MTIIVEEISGGWVSSRNGSMGIPGCKWDTSPIMNCLLLISLKKKGNQVH